jgi:GDP-4-dehydro-6-deoxy-D-mannose reductase
LRFLITGVGGFAGSHLADYLIAQARPGDEVWGCDVRGERRPFHSPALQLVSADLRDPDVVRALIDQARPERIYHLAGQASPGGSWVSPWGTLETNLRSQVNLLEAVRAARLEARILVLGSAEEYGRVSPSDLPLREDCPLRPDSPYGVSKVGQDLLGLQYFLSHGLTIVRVRPFNHIGPRQSPQFVAPAFAGQIAAIETGRQAPVVRVGRLDARRDFSDVRDIVRGYALALEQGEPGEVYNLGSGRGYSIQNLLDMLLSFSTQRISVEADPQRLRPSETPDLVCDPGKFRARTGWQADIPLEQSLRDLLDYEREQARLNV